MARLSSFDRMIAGSIHSSFFFPNILKYVRGLIKNHDFNYLKTTITCMKRIGAKDVTNTDRNFVDNFLNVVIYLALVANI